MTSAQYTESNSDKELVDDIKKYGWVVMLIEATDYLPSFAYTVGLWKNYHHPELISFGLTSKTLHAILNNAGELVKNGRTLKLKCDYDDFFENGTVQLLQVDPNNLKDYFGYAIWFNSTIDFPALQLVWTDRNNKFPWDKDFEKEFRYKQPLLDRNAAFKFYESKRLAVFTTRQCIENGSPILEVVHDNDGAWQFLTGDQMPEDIKIVALESLTLRDPTLNDVFNLDYGEAAKRNFIGDKWIRSSFKMDE